MSVYKFGLNIFTWEISSCLFRHIMWHLLLGDHDHLPAKSTARKVFFGSNFQLSLISNWTNNIFIAERLNHGIPIIKWVHIDFNLVHHCVHTRISREILFLKLGGGIIIKWKRKEGKKGEKKNRKTYININIYFSQSVRYLLGGKIALSCIFIEVGGGGGI